MDLIQTCGNGAAIAVTKGNPQLVLPDFSYSFMIILAGAAITMSKVKGKKIRLSLFFYFIPFGPSVLMDLSC